MSTNRILFIWCNPVELECLLTTNALTWCCNQCLAVIQHPKLSSEEVMKLECQFFGNVRI